MYVIGVNCFGDIEGQYYSVDSCVINLDGEILAMISDQNGKIKYDLNDDVLYFRQEFPVLDDSRSETYDKLQPRKTYGNYGND